MGLAPSAALAVDDVVRDGLAASSQLEW